MSQQEELVCRDFVELVTEYLEASVLEPLKTRIEEHLDECEDCERYLDQIRKTISLLGKLASAAPVSDEAQTELTELFRQWKAASSG